MKNKIAKLRKAHNMSQTDLANEVFVIRQTITSLETYKFYPTLKLAYKIANFFKLTIEDVFDFSEVVER